MSYSFCEGVSCELLVCFSACTYGCHCLPIDNESGAPEDPGNTNNNLGSSVGSLLQCNEEKPINDRSPAAESPPPVGPSCSSRAPEGDFLETSTSSSVHQNPLKRRKHESKGKVAFVKVKVGANASRTDKLDSRIKSAADMVDEKKEDEDPFFSMLTGGNMKRSFF